MPPGSEDKILHAALSNGTATIMGSDMVEPDGVKPGNSVTACLVCDSKKEIETVFAKLAERGTVKNALNDLPFGTYGDLVDKFGQAWTPQFSSS